MDRREVHFAVFEKWNNNNCTFSDIPGDDGTFSSSYSVEEDIDFVFNGVGISLLALFGIPANVLSVIVLRHPKMKSSLTTLLLGLTISDIFVIGGYLLTMSLDKVLNRIRVFPEYYIYIRPHICPWLHPITETAQLSSIFFTIVITLERYIAVCHPLKVRSLCTRSSAIRSFIIVVAVSIIYNIPRWFDYSTVPVANCDGKVLWYDFNRTELMANEAYVLYYDFWGYTLMFFVIPFGVLVYFNIFIYLEVKQQRSLRSSLNSTKTSEKSEDLQLAGMLFGIVITFLICYVLNLVKSVMESCEIFIPNYLFPLSNFLLVFSHSSNFIFYCAFGTRFRRHLRETLRIKLRQNSRRQNSQSSGSQGTEETMT